MLHLPINVISILSYGISFWLFLGIVISVLNLFGVGWSLWKLDVMRGERGFYGKVYVWMVLSSSEDRRDKVMVADKMQV